MGLTEAEMVRLWESHTRLEFATKDAEATVATMAPDNYVNHVPVMTGGRGRDEMIEFYSRQLIPKMPADTTLRLPSTTVGPDWLIDEFDFSFTHDVETDWILLGVPPTHRKVELAMVVVVQVEGDKIACERIYWDQASVLVQPGLLDPTGLPVVGVDSASSSRTIDYPRTN
jgi:carboxymethylenebutenolidase